MFFLSHEIYNVLEISLRNKKLCLRYVEAITSSFMESHSQENHVGDVKSNTLNKLQITKKHKIQISYTMMTEISHQTETI